jgi:hypothetical protein
VGSIKWLEDQPFDQRDLARLVAHRAQLPGVDDETPCSPSRSGCTAHGVRQLGPADLLEASP